MFYGQGAGKRPTASAVVADIIDTIKHLINRRYLEWGDVLDGFISDSRLLKSRWLVRAGGDLEDIAAQFGNVRFITYNGAPEDEYVFISEEMDVYQVKKKTNRIELRSLLRVLD
jgi:homoserine dehydrogenase